MLRIEIVSLVMILDLFYFLNARGISYRIFYLYTFARKNHYCQTDENKKIRINIIFPTLLNVMFC